MKPLQILQAEIGQWSRENFGDQTSKATGEVLGPCAPALGVLEELGEYCHCVLKHHQGIRGFDVEAKFIEESNDAIADMSIYRADLCERADDEYELTDATRDQLEAIGFAAFHLGDLLLSLAADNEEARNTIINDLWFDLERIAGGKDAVEQMTNETWDRIVSKRNWKPTEPLPHSH